MRRSLLAALAVFFLAASAHAGGAGLTCGTGTPPGNASGENCGALTWDRADATYPNDSFGFTVGSDGALKFRAGLGTSGAELLRLTGTGSLGLATTGPRVSVDFGSKTDALILQTGTTGQRPTAVAGMIRYNSTTPAVEAYVNNAWTSLGSGGGSSTILLGTSTAATNPQVSGDATTGLYSDTATTVQIATGGAERLRVTATGSVGIGTSSPMGAFSVYTSAAAGPNSAWLSGTCGGCSIKTHIYNDYASDGSSSLLALDANWGSGPQLYAGLLGIRQSNLSGSLGFITSDSSGASIERMRLTATGSLGLGTSVPTAFLDVQGGTAPATTVGGGIKLIAQSASGTNLAGGAITITGGAPTGSGAAGAISITGGAAGSAAGGAVTIAGGGSTSGAAGAVTLQGGTPTAGAGGAATVKGSAGVGTNQAGGSLTLQGGAATGTGTAGAVGITGGGSATAAGGDVTLTGGTPTGAAGGNIKLVGAAGVGTNKNGGNINLTPGAATGTGIAGGVILGTTATAKASVDFSGKSDALILQTASAVQGASCTTTLKGGIRYNSGLNYIEYCNGTTWSAFVASGNAPPVNGATGAGYFVLSYGTYTGSSINSLATADSVCLSDLTSHTSWMGYSTANTNGWLVASHVHGFACLQQGSCNNALPSTTYYFANASSSSAGGASFTTDSSGLGPNDTNPWSAANYFGVSVNYWSFRATTNNGASKWDATDSGANYGVDDCCNWGYGSTGQSGATNGALRWYASVGNNGTAQNIICMVNP